MARVQLVIPDEDRDRFVHQARREGTTLSAWLRSAAHQRLGEKQQARPFRSAEDVGDFFRTCDSLEGPATEPDWEEHRKLIERSRHRGAADS